MKIFALTIVFFTIFGLGNGARRGDRQGHRRGGQQFELEGFTKESLSEKFQKYNVSACSADVNSCLRQIHRHAANCMSQLKRKSGAKFDECSQRPDIKSAARAFGQASFAWHDSLDKCLMDRAPPRATFQFMADSPSDDENDNDNDDNDNDNEGGGNSYARRKRGTGHGSRRGGGGASGQQSSRGECMSHVQRHKETCTAKAVRCDMFSSCYGEGPEPTASDKRQWFNLVKQQRKVAQTAGAESMRKLTLCLNEGQGQGQGQPAGTGSLVSHHDEHVESEEDD